MLDFIYIFLIKIIGQSSWSLCDEKLVLRADSSDIYCYLNDIRLDM